MRYSIKVGVNDCKVGVNDWSRFMSDGGFYPSDLPEEWRLGYFSNEFETACLKLSALPGQGDLLLDWVEDLDDSFELFFWLDGLSQFEWLRDLRQQAGLRISGLILETPLYQSLAENGQIESLCTDLAIESNNPFMDAASLWRPAAPVNNATIALMPGPESVRQCRDWIEQWLAQLEPDSSVQSLTLWLDGTTTTYPLLTECRTLVELMGY